MKRIVIWGMTTLTLVVLLFGYKTSRQGAVSSTPPAAISGSLATAPSSSASSTSGGSSSTKQPSKQPTKQPSATATPSTTTTKVSGDEAQTQWGPVQVELTLSGGKVTDVAVPVYPNSTGRDLEINSYALPILVQETLKSQSAQIDMVSGATVTSGGYVQSLQSALDKAGL